HWYLAGRDRNRGDLRNFRLSRITAPKRISNALQTPDYMVPPTFRLRDHARSRHVWELGDSDATQALVEFRGASGATLAASQLGSPVEGRDMVRSFSVRRMDSFARWILSFGTEVQLLSPDPLVALVREMAVQTRRVYAGDPPASLPAPAGPALRTAPARKPWEPKGAAVQLKRLLLVVPQIADGEDHDLADVAARVGTDVATLQADLNSLVDRYDTPAGFVEGVRIYIEVSTVSAHSQHLRRPMRLTVPELCALELGLAVLRTQRPPDEQPSIDRARTRLRKLMARLPNDPVPDSLYNVSLGECGSVAHLVTVRAALRQRVQLRIGYRKSASSVTEMRTVCPYALLAFSGMMYLVARCEQRGGVRVFRLDRVQSAALTDVSFTPPTDFSVDDVLRDGRVFHGAEAGTMRVRYSARIARWIAEREGRALDIDGSVVIEHPLADRDWACRHVLQYAADAEVLHPVELRAQLATQLDAVVREYSA
ncbi:MAG TPA: WYL domain-containing protein, partial [Gemmatimonadaceae bacterium]|nr:WYL domain-containing protein [Gemmatimonadaceae bacterium]